MWAHDADIYVSDAARLQRGVDLDQLLDMNSDQLVELFHARARCAAMGSGRHFNTAGGICSPIAQPPWACSTADPPIPACAAQPCSLRCILQAPLPEGPEAQAPCPGEAPEEGQEGVQLGCMGLHGLCASPAGEKQARTLLGTPFEHDALLVVCRRMLPTARSPTLCAPTCAT